MNILNKKQFSIYLIILFIFSVFYLYQKHLVGNDSTISEWLINYEGGFTKRGLIGQIAIYLSYLIDIKLRLSIFIFQITVIAVYYIFLNNFISNLKFNNLIIFSLFTPIFVLYPVAEIEVLARKETFLYCFFLLYFLLDNKTHKNIYKLTILPVAILVWEPVIFFFPFWIIIDFFEQDERNIIKSFFNIIIFYLPAIFLAFFIAFNPISSEGHKEMANFLKNEFNEACYMSCELLLSKSKITQQFTAVIDLFTFERIIRYFLVLIIGFGPLIILIQYSKFKKLNAKIISLFISLPIIVLFLMMTDWGRVVNMYYTFSILTFLYLFKKNYLQLNQLYKQNFFVKLFKTKKLLIFFFIIFCFGWNPKTSIVGDVGSKPGYQIPRKALKIIYFKYIKKNY